MKIIIDTDVCIKEGKEPDTMLYLLSLLSGYPITLNTFEKARQQGLLKFSQMYDPKKSFPDYVSLSDTGVFVAESVVGSSATSEQPKDRFEVLAGKMMECFPEGYKQGSDSHTKQPWRGNKMTIADRLRKFVVKYGDYTDEEFVDATKRYVANNINSPYMRILLYFIYKNVVGEKQVVNGRLVGDTDRISPLADYLSNKDDKPANDNWDVTLF